LYHSFDLTLLGFFFLFRGYRLGINDRRSEAFVTEMSNTCVEKILRNSHSHGQARISSIEHS
jgi:hypothetical protein